MKFPRRYVVIDKKYQLPPLGTIQNWVQSDEAVYMEGVDEDEGEFEAQVIALKSIHFLIDSEGGHEARLIIFHGTTVPIFLSMALGSHRKNVLWADSDQHLNEITEFTKNIGYLEIFETSCYRADIALSALTDTIRAKTGSGLVGEDAYWRSVSGRENFDNESEAKIVLRKIARGITRAGVLRRIDLENEPAELKEAEV